MRQLELSMSCSTTVKKASLVAPSSAKQAFYKMWLKETDGTFEVYKESGIGQTVLDRRSWAFEKFETAEQFFNRKIKAKINPLRKSPRKYKYAYPRT